MQLLLKCHEERAGSKRPDYCVVNLSTEVAELILKRHGRYLELEREDLALKQMVWAWDEAPAKFYDLGDNKAPDFWRKDCIELPDSFESHKVYKEIAVETIQMEIWDTGDIVIGGLMRGTEYNHFHTGYIPMSVIEEMVNDVKAA